MGDKGEGGVKNLKKWVMSLIDGQVITKAPVDNWFIFTTYNYDLIKSN